MTTNLRGPREANPSHRRPSYYAEAGWLCVPQDTDIEIGQRVDMGDRWVTIVEILDRLHTPGDHSGLYYLARYETGSQ